MNLSSLRGDGERLLAGLAEARYRDHAGLRPTTDLPSLFKQFSLVGSSEAVALVREELASAGDDSRRRQWRRLFALCTLAAEGRRTARFDEEARGFEASCELRVHDERFPFRDALRRVAEEPDERRRGDLALAREEALGELDKTLPRRIEATHEVALELGFSSYEALVQEATGIDLAALAAEAEGVLAASEDAYRDLLGYGLRRAGLGAQLRPRGDAAWHDLVRFRRLSRLDDVLRAKRLTDFTAALFEGIGIRDVRGRIGLDDARRARKASSPLVLGHHVPREIWLSVKPLLGAPDFRDALFVLGSAHHLAGLDEGFSFEDRAFGDRSLNVGFGLGFSQLLLDPGMLVRLLDADPRDAVEASRLVAVSELGRLRQACAQLVYERTLYREGARSGLDDLYCELMGKALLVEWPREGFLAEVEPGFASAHTLRGYAFEAVLHRALQDRADEDHWRNPRMGPLLDEWWQKGVEGDAAAMARELGGALSLTDAVRRLTTVAAT